ncbi:nitrate- and nitrite sensing domain-containing protein [Nocardia higoensis]|uniref:histidine kinase n=1 Tax=Nocardia higoensis TaxID=228599 RepID=A0ABS0D5B8_9NOCA|nr:nitrate- and nitrite sensing domain-containing protein [Nocardia higoensis]MBF6353531.1 nitrate- and nitrite sensing domain-containing protein [Nocardia higoensis]
MFKARLGVRGRILAIALVPSLTLLVIGVGTAGYLVDQGSAARDWAEEIQIATPATREFVEALQQERHYTVATLTGDAAATPALTAARVRLDGAVRNILETTSELKVGNGNEEDAKAFHAVIDHLVQLRQGVDVRQIPVLDAYGFFSQILDRVAAGTRTAQEQAPDTEIGVQLSRGVRLLYAAEGMSRSNALALALAATESELDDIPMDELVYQIGYYHTEINLLAADTRSDQQEQAAALLSSPAWQQVTAVESALLRGDDLPGNLVDWQEAANQLNRSLLDLWISHSLQTEDMAEDTYGAAARNSLLTGGGVLAISVSAFLIALALANRIIRRLKKLRGETLALADVSLPETMRKLREGEIVDAAGETPRLDYGDDEIGEVAQAFEHAHAAAVTAAVDEARTREGVKAVFLNIAHRSQIVVHRQLEILDEAESKQEDPAMLETLFRLDHLATRERRNAENLIVLGGGMPGRQWRNPIPLVDLVRAAVGETLDYARVQVQRIPDANVLGSAVADLGHLIAELVDNAISYSPPQSKVEVSGNLVGRGVVVEISDQGMGMPEGELARVNEMLRNPPDFGVARLSADSRLGLFVVAQLAVRHGVSVRLSESNYGGVRAVVLIPSALLAPEPSAEIIEERALPVSPPRYEPVPDRPAPEFPESSVATLAPPESIPPRIAPERPVPSAYTPLGGKPELPRRRRQENLAPELTHTPTPEPSAERERSPEQARDLMSAIENGTRQGRRERLNEGQEGQQ